MTAGNTRLESNTVANLQGFSAGADGDDGASGFVAEDHGLGENEVGDAAVFPVVDLLICLILRDVGGVQSQQTHVGTANTSDIDADEHVLGVLESWDWTVLEDHVLDGVQDE